MGTLAERHLIKEYGGALSRALIVGGFAISVVVATYHDVGRWVGIW
jgi:hypothetical protein